MKTRSLMAIKPHRYGTRHLTAGEQYEAPIKHAFALVAGKKAKFAPDKPSRAVKAPMVAEPESFDHLNKLRLQATQLGIDIDGRWGTARLQHEIAQAKR